VGRKDDIPEGAVTDPTTRSNPEAEAKGGAVRPGPPPGALTDYPDLVERRIAWIEDDLRTLRLELRSLMYDRGARLPVGRLRDPP
jgi:hypothetical protein